ncbi:Uncharacterized protein Fot_04098 [Forsythia ovata]|uniref:Uncharacterized protein n=1 Tax=Forsythia ovata TaxID=205694 RepID=A0ABD1XBK9_9LAMI
MVMVKTSGLKVDEKTVDIQCNNSVEQSLRTGSPPKKKHKRRHDEDGSHVVIPESGDAQHRKHNLLDATAALLGVQIEQFQNEFLSAIQSSFACSFETLMTHLMVYDLRSLKLDRMENVFVFCYALS